MEDDRDSGSNQDRLTNQGNRRREHAEKEWGLDSHPGGYKCIGEKKWPKDILLMMIGRLGKFEHGKGKGHSEVPAWEGHSQGVPAVPNSKRFLTGGSLFPKVSITRRSTQLLGSSRTFDKLLQGWVSMWVGGGGEVEGQLFPESLMSFLTLPPMQLPFLPEICGKRNSVHERESSATSNHPWQ